MMRKCKTNMMNLLAKVTRIASIGFMILFLLSFSQKEALHGVVTGIYDNGRLILAKHDSLKTVTGIINATEDNVSCRLYIYGSYSAINNGVVKIYNPADNEIYEGKLTIDKRGLIIRSNKVMFPCQRIMDLTGGESFLLSKAITKDVYLGIVKSPKAFLYDVPEKITSKKSFLIEGDIVSIKQQIGSWMKVAYLNKPSLVKWVKCRDLKVGE